MWELGGYFFYLSRRLLKYSARAIIKDNIISNSANVMYMVITSLQQELKGSEATWECKKRFITVFFIERARADARQKESSLPSVRREATATVYGALRVL